MTGHNPTDRSKLGSKRHSLTDKNDIPLSTFIIPANTHDVTVATNTIDNIVIKRPSTSSKSKYKQNLCLDKAYLSKEVEQEIIKRDTFLIYVTEERRKTNYFIKNILQEDR